MTKLKTIGVASILGLAVGFSLAAQTPEALAGTWVGPATLDVEPEPNELKLVLKIENGEITGHISDEYGVLNEVPLEDVVLEGNAFSFSASAAGPSGDMLVLKFAMTVEGNSMQGKLEIPDMSASGTWSAEKIE